MLTLSEVSLSFSSRKSLFNAGVHPVLKGISLELHAGETLGIIGRNGVGKSSILRVMAGILAPSAGRVWRRPGTSASLLTLGLGFKPRLSGRENALLAAMLQGASRAEAESSLGAIKEFSELGDSFEESVMTYSTGMRSRLGFTTALITHVDVLLIDEVLAVGDAGFRRKAEQAMRERITGDQTVVFVSHMDAQIRSLCDRALWLEQGEIREQGDTAAVLRKYRESISG